MKHNYYLPLVALAFLFQCCTASTDEAIGQNSSNDEIIIKPRNIYQRTSQEAIGLVNEMLSIATTRSQAPQYSVEALLGEDYILDSLNSVSNYALPDTLAYLVNVNLTDGYYLVPGDSRINKLLIYNDTGHMALSQMPVDAGAQIYLSWIPLFLREELQKYENPNTWELGPRGPVCPPLPLDHFFYQYGPWEVLDSVPVLVPYEWNQGFPYNSHITNQGFEYTGCAAVAAGQLMATYKYPNSIDGQQIYWDIIEDFPSYDSISEDLDWRANGYSYAVGYLMGKICESLNCVKTETGTSAYIEDIPPMLSDYGYTHFSDITNYNSNDVIQSLKNGHAVIIRGSDFKNKKGHIWLIDGYRKQKRKVIVYDNYNNSLVREYYDEQVMLHCNWGEGKNKYDGWYHEGVFDAYHNYYSIIGKDVSGYYRHDLRCIYNIYP